MHCSLANERHQSSVRFFFHSLLWFYSCDAIYRTIPRMFESKRNCADWYLESFSWMRTVEKLSHLTSSALYHEMHSIQSSTSELEHWTLIFPLSSSSSSSGALNGIVCAFGAMLLWTLDWRWKLSKKYRKCMFWCTWSNLIKTPLISSHSTRIWICSAALVSHQQCSRAEFLLRFFSLLFISNVASGSLLDPFFLLKCV